MKLVFCSLTLAAMPLVAVAETTTYACQYTSSAGLAFEDEQWKPTRFELLSPFFLKAENNKLDPATILKSVDIGADHSLPTCVTHQEFDEVESCSSAWGESLVFNHETMIGAMSEIYNAAWDDDFDSEQLSVSTFFCQAM